SLQFFDNRENGTPLFQFAGVNRSRSKTAAIRAEDAERGGRRAATGSVEQHSQGVPEREEHPGAIRGAASHPSGSNRRRRRGRSDQLWRARLPSQSVGALLEKSRGRSGGAGRGLSGAVDRDGGWPAGSSQGGRCLSPSRPCLSKGKTRLHAR